MSSATAAPAAAPMQASKAKWMYNRRMNQSGEYNNRAFAARFENNDMETYAKYRGKGDKYAILEANEGKRCTKIVPKPEQNPSKL